MTDKLENPPAYPLFCGAGDMQNNSGMTLRDYCATKAMAAIISLGTDFDYDLKSDESPANQVAFNAYIMADAMLAARLK